MRQQPPRQQLKPSVTKSNANENNTNYLNGGGFARRPKTITCTICGREFGTTSLEIHQKTCIKKYQNDLIQMDPGHRTQMPSTKQVMEKVEQQKQMRQMAQSGVKQINSSFQISEQPTSMMGLVGCRRCGRKFNPDRIRKHESVCIGPDTNVAAVKQKQIEQNKKAARQLRPKQTGKWRQEHHEFMNAMKEMRKYAQEDRNRGVQQQSFGSYGNSRQSQQSYGRQINNRPPSSQTNKVSHKQPRVKTPPTQQVKQQPKRNASNVVQQKSANPFGGMQERFSGASKGGGGGNYQISHSNVSTFSLFTQDGKPNNYNEYQKNNPYAKKTGLY